MKVALVHDDLMQWGGAERVLKALTEIFPDAPIYTAIYDKNNSLLRQQFQNNQIVTSFLQKIPFKRVWYKALLPLYPIAFESFDFSNYDLVLSQTTRFAKSIITKPGTTHLCLCHTPPRFLWHFSGIGESRLQLLTNFLRLYDVISARRVDHWLAGSDNAKRRIAKVYKAPSVVCQPFVDLDGYKDIEAFDGGYYLIIARLNQYKKVDVAINLFNKTGQSLKIVGVGPELLKLKRLAKPNIEFHESVSETLLKNLMAGARALIVMAEEDFGLTPLEAQALGKPVVAYGKGGVLETVSDGKTGILFSEQTEQSLEEALIKLSQLTIKPADCLDNVSRFSKANFSVKVKRLVEELLKS